MKVYQTISICTYFQQQMLLFGEKIKTIKDYDQELNYILYQYRSQKKRKTIQPFLTLMRHLKHNQEEVDRQLAENKDFITPFQFIGKYLQTAQNADRFHTQQQTEEIDTTHFNKVMQQQNEDFFGEELSDLVNRYELFQVEQQENLSNAVSQQKQQSQNTQNKHKMLYELTQNDSVFQSKCTEKQQIQEFKYFIRRAVNNQKFKLKLDIPTKTLSEQKEKERNQLIGNCSDLRSDSSKQNTTHSERKLQNNNSSPYSKQLDEDSQKINVEQILFQKNSHIFQINHLFDEQIKHKSRKQLQKYSNNQTIDKHNSEYDAEIHQKDNQDKYLKPKRQSQTEVNQISLKQTAQRNIKKIKIIKSLHKSNKFINQSKCTQENSLQCDQQQKIQTQYSSNQAAFEQIVQNNFQKNKKGFIYQFENNISQTKLLSANQENFSKDVASYSYAHAFRPNSFIPKITNMVIKNNNDQTRQLNNFDDNQDQLDPVYIKNKIEINSHSQELLHLDQQKKSKFPQVSNQQYGNKNKSSQLLNRVSYANSFKKQRQKDEKEKKQLNRTKSKVSPQKNQKNKISKLDVRKEQSRIFQIVQVKQYNTQEQQHQDKINQEKNQQTQIAIKSQPLKRQPKNEILVKSASHIQHYPPFNHQHINSQAKQNSHIKVKSISGTKSQEQENLLKMMGGSEHLKQLSSLVIQPKQLCFQMQKQQLVHFMVANSISIKSQPSYEESEDISINSSTFRFTPNNLTTFNLQDALQEDNKGLNLNELSSGQKQEIKKYRKTQQNGTEEQKINLNEESETFQRLFVGYKKFNNKTDQLEMAVIEQLQSNKIMSSSESHAQVNSRTYQDYRNHFNPKRALSRMKQQRRTSQIKKENTLRLQKEYHSVSPSKRNEGAIQGIKKRWEKNAQRFRTKMYNF